MSAIEEKDEAPVGTGTGSEPDDPNLDLFVRLKRDIISAERDRSKWRKEATEAFGFVENLGQWSAEDKAILEDENRPAITFNRCAPIVNAVCGLEINNRQSVVYLPRQVGDAGVNESYTAAGKWLRDECNAEDEESEAFRDMVICGEGWTETRMDYDENPQGQPVIEKIDALEMGVNKGASRRNYLDARMIYRIRDMFPDDVRMLADLDPRLEAAAMDARWLKDSAQPEDGGQGNKKDYPDKTRGGIGDRLDGNRKETVKIVQCQYWRREAVNMVATDTDTEVQQMSDEEFATFKNRAAILMVQGQPINYQNARVMKRVYYECFIGVRVLSVRKLDMGMFQFKALTGYRDTKLKCFFGMLRDMKDPQMWANKWLSQILHIINTNAKGGLLAETDAFQNVRKAERDWADPKKVVWVKPGSLQKQKVKERTAGQLPNGLDQLMMLAISSIRDVTGVNLELLGQADREQAASLESQRRQSAMTVLAAMFDSLRRYRKLQGKLMLQFIQLLPEGTLIRVLEKGQYKYIPLMKQDSTEHFDVIIDQAPTSPDQKQFVWAITAQILQMNILPPQAIVELLKYSPYPESVVMEIRKALGVDGEMPAAQLQEQLKQAEGALQFLEQKLQEETAKTKELQDAKAIDLLQTKIDAFEAETHRLKAQWDARIKAAGAVISGTQTENQDRQASASLENQVVSGEQSLPDIPDMRAEIGELKDMVGHMMQMFADQQAGSVPPPTGIPPEQAQA